MPFRGVCYHTWMNTLENKIQFNGYDVWYSLIGDIDNGTLPLFVLHGGPGFPHNHLENLSELAGHFPVVLYDQLGCGLSDRPEDTSIYSVDMFVEELEALRKHLGIDMMNLLGHSWGGSLAAEYALKYPSHLGRLILSSPLIDTQLWLTETDNLKDQLAPEVAAVMRKHETAGTTDTKEYLEAYEIFKNQFLCRLVPNPKSMVDAEAGFGEKVYNAMWGPSETSATGVLKDWSVMDRLGSISVPTLFISGRYDEATPSQIEAAHAQMPSSQWVLLEESSHSSNLEQPVEYLATVKAFLSVK